MVDVAGPLTCVQAVDVMLAPLVPTAVPASVTELAGNVMICADPALTTGGVFAGLTVMVTVAFEVRPWLSVAVILKVNTPAIKPDTVVIRLDAELIVAVFGPLASVQATLLMVAPFVPEAVPVSVMVLRGSITICAVPALTTGGEFAVFTVMVTVEEFVKP
jgi:hypothetical protein